MASQAPQSAFVVLTSLNTRLVSKAFTHAPQSRTICDLLLRLAHSDSHQWLYFNERLYDEFLGAGVLRKGKLRNGGG